MISLIHIRKYRQKWWTDPQLFRFEFVLESVPGIVYTWSQDESLCKAKLSGPILSSLEVTDNNLCTKCLSLYLEDN